MAAIRRGSFFGLVVLAILSGCQSGATTRAPGKPDLAVVERGAEPRRVLGYVPRPGERKVVVRLTTVMAGLQADQGMRLLLQLDWKAPRVLTEAWPFAVEKSAIGSPAIGGGQGERLAERLVVNGISKGFENIAGVVTPHSASHFDYAQTAGPPSRPSLLSILSWFVVPLPDVPLGRGAKWEVRRAGPADGGAETQRVIYEVVELGPDQVTLRVEGHTTWINAAEPPKGAGPAMQQSSSEVIRRGTLVVNAGDILPTSGHLTATETVKMTIQIPGPRDAKDRDQEFVSNTELDIESLEAPRP
jgi:hypothetical protein